MTDHRDLDAYLLRAMTFADGAPIGWQSASTLARNSGATVSLVARRLMGLADAGQIERTIRDGQRLYRAVCPDCVRDEAVKA